MKVLNVGLIGLGTVGTGVLKVLRNFENVKITKVAVKNLNKKRNIENFDENLLTDNPFEIVENPDIDIVVEVIGGVEPAYSLIKKAINSGKHIVTANKELLAKKGEELFTLAKEKNIVILYEAAIAGGIPIITPIKTTLRANKIKKIAGILNGTTNYILTMMTEKKASYSNVLAEAQKLGYAETDPSGDVDGFDAAYKITTLATIAFNQRIHFKNIYREGITSISAQDIAFAQELGYKIKLIALAQIDEFDNADVRVHPMLVKNSNSLAHIDYVTNAVLIDGDPVGEIMFSGAGAGEKPTSSSVVGDILILAQEIDKSDNPLVMMRCEHSKTANQIDISQTTNKYYISIKARNSQGVIGTLGNIFAENNINIQSLLQKGINEDNTAEVIVITELCKESNVQNAVSQMKTSSNIAKINNLIRVME